MDFADALHIFTFPPLDKICRVCKAAMKQVPVVQLSRGEMDEGIGETKLEKRKERGKLVKCISERYPISRTPDTRYPSNATA